MNAPALLVATILGLCLLSCGGSDPAGSEPLTLRVAGVEKSVTCEVFFAEEQSYVLAFYWPNGVFTIAVSWDHVVESRIDPSEMESAGLRILEPSLTRSRALELSGTLVWFQSVPQAMAGGSYPGNALDIRARYQGLEGEEILVELTGTFGLDDSKKVNLLECFDAPDGVSR